MSSHHCHLFSFSSHWIHFWKVNQSFERFLKQNFLAFTEGFESYDKASSRKKIPLEKIQMIISEDDSYKYTMIAIFTMVAIFEWTKLWRTLCSRCCKSDDSCVAIWRAGCRRRKKSHSFSRHFLDSTFCEI